MFMPGVDTDGDGLDDAWEYAAGDSEWLDWELPDTDGDGEHDGEEDPDGDGLTNLDEFALSRLTPLLPMTAPHPFRVDIPIELDQMAETELPMASLSALAAAGEATPIMGVSGYTGVGFIVYLDESDLERQTFSGSFPERHRYFRTHGPSRFTDEASPPIPYDAMVHVVIAVERRDLSMRGAEVVTSADGRIENTGIFLYHDVIRRLHPRCGLEGEVPDIVFEEAMFSSLLHELGHVLQLGHDTMVGGGVNYFNVMSQPRSCLESQMRFHGLMNDDITLGATAAVGASRFSLDAVMLMRLRDKISVDTAVLIEDPTGFEM